MDKSALFDVTATPRRSTSSLDDMSTRRRFACADQARCLSRSSRYASRSGIAGCPLRWSNQYLFVRRRGCEELAVHSMWAVELNAFVGVSAEAYVALESGEVVGVRADVAVLRRKSGRGSFGGWARSQLRWVSSNNRFERSRGGSSFGEPRRGSMIGIKYLRLTLAQPRVAQPHR